MSADYRQLLWRQHRDRMARLHMGGESRPNKAEQPPPATGPPPEPELKPPVVMYKRDRASHIRWKLCLDLVCDTYIRRYRDDLDDLQERPITEADIYSQCRAHDVVRARHIAIYLSKVTTKLSFNELGKRFNRDHTSTMNAFNVIERRMEGSPDFAREIDNLLQLLNQRHYVTPAAHICDQVNRYRKEHPGVAQIPIEAVS